MEVKVKRNWQVTLALLPLALWSGCAGLTHHKDEAALSQVKKVAVVGFAVNEPAPPINLNTKDPIEIDQMYVGLVKAFEKQGWKSLPPATIRANAGYKAAYESTMKGFQNKYPPGQKQRRLLAGEIMDNDSLRILDVSGRDVLMKALGVDALVTAQVDVILTGTAVLGIGAQYPFARLSFWLYTRGKNSPDWFEGGLDGETAKESVGATAFIDVDLMHRLALKSAQTAYSKIGSQQSQ